MDDRTDAARQMELINASRTDLRQKTTLNDRFIYRLLAVTYLLGFGGQHLVAVIAPQFTDPASIILALTGSAAVFVILAHSSASTTACEVARLADHRCSEPPG